MSIFKINCHICHCSNRTFSSIKVFTAVHWGNKGIDHKTFQSPPGNPLQSGKPLPTSFRLTKPWGNYFFVLSYFHKHLCLEMFNVMESLGFNQHAPQISNLLISIEWEFFSLPSWHGFSKAMCKVYAPNKTLGIWGRLMSCPWHFSFTSILGATHASYNFYW